MKILLVATTSYAGMGPYVTQIINSFNKEDSFYFLLREFADDYFRKNIKKELLDNCFFYKKENSNWNKLFDLFFDDRKFTSYVLHICKTYDIRVVHFLNGPVYATTLKELIQNNIKALGTIHDLHPHEAHKEWYKMLRHKISSQRVSRNLNYNNCLVTNSYSQYTELQQLYPLKHIFYFPFPSLVTNEIATGNNIPKELLSIKMPYILFFGRIEQYKGLHILYQAFLSDRNLYNNYLLVIAGKGYLGIEKSAQEKNVVYINRYISDTEIRYLYENAFCVVYPYLSATQSGVLSLACFFGTPIISSDISFFKIVLDGSNAGYLFRNGDVEDLKNKLLLLASKDRHEIQEAEKTLYEKIYSNASLRKDLLCIYNKIMGIK